ncbi:MAG TPA: hypothetical protein PK156_00200 [Polyangium sp.]|nr:hypothetical protein [Polyangium sp.]
MPERVKRSNLSRHPFTIESPGGYPHNPGPVVVHDPAVRVRQTLTKRANNNQYRVTLTRDDNGDTVYLPYQPEQIHSIELPAAPANGVRNFLTANLTGCWIFIELKANRNIVVYHANRSAGVSPTDEQSATDPMFQTEAARLGLLDLYRQTAPNAASHWEVLRKRDYMRRVAEKLDHKAALGRTGVTYARPEQMCQTTVAGFFRGGRWEFWYQTYGQFYYRRPPDHRLSRRGQETVNPAYINDDHEILEARLFYPAP